jgi:ABC-type uncharacterized transport system involved in gliding motility auxiliary subunit
MKEQLKKADVLGLVLIASALISYFIRKTWTNYQTGVIVAGGILLVISLVLKSNEIRQTMGRRSTKFGINSAVSVLLLIGVLALVNYLGHQHQKRFDMTTERLYSLSDESVKVAAEVKSDIRIKAFYPGGEEPETRRLLGLYSNQNSKIGVEFIDPDKQPQLAKQYDVTQYEVRRNPMTGQQTTLGTVILDAGEGKIERIEKQDNIAEEDVTNALTKIVKGEKKVVYFVSGHGEKVLEGADREGYQVANGELGRAGYTVKPLNLAQDLKIPPDASVVVIAGPKTEPFPQEAEVLSTYLNGGGSVLLMLDPPPSAAMKDFTQKWSINVGNNRVIDASGMGQLLGKGPDSPLVTTYGDHKILEKFNVMTFFPLARSIQPATPPVAGLTVEPLIQSSPNSWGESDLTSNKVGFDEKIDVRGPVTIAAVVAKDAPEGKKTRLIVFGDSDFAMNANFGNQGNGNLFVNTVKWLARDENFISIKTKSPSDRPLTMTESSGRTVALLVMILFPGSVLVAGVFVWSKRRR